MPAMAYFLTWTCHGTWLHGDERWAVDRHERGRVAPHEPTRRRNAALLAGDPVILTPRARGIVEGVIAEHCDHRSWRLWAVNARSNHVHVVVAVGAVPPEKVMGEFKAWASSRRGRLGGSGARDTRPACRRSGRAMEARVGSTTPIRLRRRSGTCGTDRIVATNACDGPPQARARGL